MNISVNIKEDCKEEKGKESTSTLESLLLFMAALHLSNTGSYRHIILWWCCQFFLKQIAHACLFFLLAINIAFRLWFMSLPPAYCLIRSWLDWRMASFTSWTQIKRFTGLSVYRGVWVCGDIVNCWFWQGSLPCLLVVMIRQMLLLVSSFLFASFGSGGTYC